MRFPCNIGRLAHHHGNAGQAEQKVDANPHDDKDQHTPVAQGFKDTDLRARRRTWPPLPGPAAKLPPVQKDKPRPPPPPAATHPSPPHPRPHTTPHSSPTPPHP